MVRQSGRRKKETERKSESEEADYSDNSTDFQGGTSESVHVCRVCMQLAVVTSGEAWCLYSKRARERKIQQEEKEEEKQISEGEEKDEEEKEQRLLAKREYASF